MSLTNCDRTHSFEHEIVRSSTPGIPKRLIWMVNLDGSRFPMGTFNADSVPMVKKFKLLGNLVFQWEEILALKLLDRAIFIFKS